MDFFSQINVALRGPTGQPQSAADTIARLADRLSPSTLLADRRAAVLALKGLARDCKADVGERALLGLLDVLQNDAEVDADIGKAVLETLISLCEVDENGSAQSRELGYAFTDAVLSDEKVPPKLFALMADRSYYIRLSALQFLGLLLQNRRQTVQAYFLKTPVGVTSLITLLDEKREIIRNEAMYTIQTLISQSPEIQKIMAFEGAFEKLFNIVVNEQGTEGGVVVQDALTCVDGLLRFNQSNHSYFRGSSLPPALLSLVGFPASLPLDQPTPQQFALQLWDVPQKPTNVDLVVGVIGLLARHAGPPDGLTMACTRCLVELGLCSNAPTSIKTHALRLVPNNLASLPLAEMAVTPYMPVPDTNGEEWDRLEPSSALDALVELVLQGEYNGIIDGERRTRDNMELRTASLTVFQNFVQKEEISEAIVRAMVTPPGSQAPVTPLLYALTTVPVSPLTIPSVTTTHFATLLFAHLLRYSSPAKALARSIVPQASAGGASGGTFFVPADGGSAPPPPPDDDADEPQSVLQILSEHLSLAFLARARTDLPDREALEWDRLCVGYLCLLIQWLWEDPPAVREFLEAGALGALVEPINQTAEEDHMIPGLCALLLGVCYEFNREPGEVTRATIHPILMRLGIDTLAGRIVRLRDDDRFKAVGPDVAVVASPTAPGHKHPSGAPPASAGVVKADAEEGELWFDWAFVDFWKSNYYTIQKGIAVEPNALSSAAGQESGMLIASLRDVIRGQNAEIEKLQGQLKALSGASAEVEALRTQVATLTTQLKTSDERKRDVEKEQEDLLVLLDELNSKRRKDKERMRGAGLEVSEDEAEDDDDDDEDEDEEEEE
ncbi:p115 like vesicle tethering protein [Epithele typhae]|uniref:p115 like vesicle tethering protein n=1 Tax=Epithele typhae TaxID=378194 RepID=UPI002008E3FA|nr:p115 like vesicle tethering protein [Epithele typhae]KAH9935197.1 p115 like vesicle tethering protein [Epithele typhae]